MRKSGISEAKFYFSFVEIMRNHKSRSRSFSVAGRNDGRGSFCGQMEADFCAFLQLERQQQSSIKGEPCGRREISSEAMRRLREKYTREKDESVRNGKRKRKRERERRKGEKEMKVESAEQKERKERQQ